MPYADIIIALTSNTIDRNAIERVNGIKCDNKVI